mgnify:CR=1 FL=1
MMCFSIVFLIQSHLWVMAIIIAVALFIILASIYSDDSVKSPSRRRLEMLKRKYEKGDISEEEYERKKREMKG